MDKRKFMFKSLHKNLQPEEHSLEKIDSDTSSKQTTGLHTTNITIQDKTNSLNGQLSDIGSCILKPINNRLLIRSNTSSISSQQSCNHLSRNVTSMATNKSLTTTNFSVEKLVSQKRKVTDTTTDSDSDLDSLSNKYIKKKKHNKTLINTKTKYIGQNDNIKKSIIVSIYNRK